MEETMLTARHGLLAIVALTCALAGTLDSPISQPLQGSAPGYPEDSSATPPDRIGRLSIIEGPVSFLPAGAEEWGAAEPNRPVTEGDRLWTDATGRSEIDIGATAIRVSHDTELDVERLDDDWIQITLPQGTVSARVNDLGEDQDDEIDTPNAAIALVAIGKYRVDVSPDGDTTSITVWSGRAEVTAAGASFPVEAGQTSTIRGDSAPTYDLTDAGSPDAFDRWSLERDERADRAGMARQYVSEDTPGAADLDEYGGWEQDPTYGPIWHPTIVEAGWAPYRSGRWVWVAPWGWTWVDTAPWGFAPYHYGRWAYVRNRWGWCPGRVVRRPVYAPALVVFAGGPGWGVTLSFGREGGVAWFPLAPEEVYDPAYATNPGYRRRINVTNVTNIMNITRVTNVTNITYVNRGVADGVTAVPRGAFANGQPVARGAVRVTPEQFRSARVIGAAAPVVPTGASVVPTRATALPPARLATRPVVATHAPPPAPVPFAAQEKALRANGGRPLRQAQLSALAPSLPAGRSTVIPIHSAAAAEPGIRTLTPARPGLPPAVPPFAPGAPRRSPPPPPPSSPVAAPAPAPPAPAPVAPAPPAPVPAPPSRPVPSARSRQAPRPEPPGAGSQQARQPEPPAPRQPPHPPLDHAYLAERAQLESRHRQEFARPPAGETPAALAQRQEAEHRVLQQRFQQTRTREMPAPPPVPKPAPNPGPRPAQRPGPRPKPTPREQPQ
jgi:hypothetical protein